MYKSRDILLLCFVASCIFGQIISTQGTNFGSTGLSTGLFGDSSSSGGLTSGLGSVLSQPLSIVNNLGSSGVFGSSSQSSNLQVSAPISVSVSVPTNNGGSSGLPLGSALNIVEPLVGRVLESAVPLVGEIVGSVGGIAQNSADPALNQGVGSALNTVLDPVTGLVSNLPVVGSGLQGGSALDPVLGIVSNLPVVGQVLQGGQGSSILDPVTGLVSNLPLVGQAINQGSDIAQQPSNLPVDQVVGSLVGTVGQVAGSALNTVIQTVGSTVGSVGQTAGSIPSQPKNVISGVTGGLPVGNVVGQVVNTVSNVVNSIPVIGTPSTNVPLPSVGLCDLFKTQSSLLGPVTNLLGGSLTAPGFYVDSISKQITSKQYQLQGDYIEINFDFRLLSTIAPRASLIVYLNNQPIHKVLASDGGKTIKIPVASRLTKAIYTLGFKAQNALSDPAFTCYISNLVIYEKQIFPKWSNDLIINGGFLSNTCQSSLCVWNNQNFASNFISGWLPTPEIKIVKSLSVNANFGDKWVVELDANRNTCIRQNVPLKTGKHNLKFDWAARANSILQSNGLLVYINGSLLKQISPSDYSVHTDSLDFILNIGSGLSQVAFCGAGTSDSIGTLLTNIQLFFYDEVSNFKINKY